MRPAKYSPAASILQPTTNNENYLALRMVLARVRRVVSLHVLRLLFLLVRRSAIPGARCTVVIGVVIVAVDRVAHVILPLVDLRFLLPGQVAAVRCTVRLRLAMDAGIAILQVACL